MKKGDASADVHTDQRPPAGLDSPRWRLVPELHLRRCGDQWVAFHSGRGTTHLVDAGAGRVLACLQREPGLDLPALAARLGPESDTPAGAMTGWLTGLRDSGLVRDDA